MPGRRPATMSLEDFAHAAAPHLHILSISQPVPVLRRHNLLAVARYASDVRYAVLTLQAEAIDDDKVGVVVMGTDPDLEQTNGRANPQEAMVAGLKHLGEGTGALVGVAHDVTDVSIASLHEDDPSAIAEVRPQLEEHFAIAEVDGRGRIMDYSPPGFESVAGSGAP